MAHAINHRTGQTIELSGEDLSDDQVRAEIASAEFRATPEDSRTALVANLASSLQQTLSSGEADIQQPQATLPQGFETGAGLTPDQVTSMLQMQQRSNESVVAQKQQQRQSVVEQIEAEKDRAQELKLQDILEKNRQTAEKANFERKKQFGTFQSKLAVEEEELIGPLKTTQRIKEFEATRDPELDQLRKELITEQIASARALTLSRGADPSFAEPAILSMPAAVQEAEVESLASEISARLVRQSPEFSTRLRQRATELAKKNNDNNRFSFKNFNLGIGRGEPTEEQIQAEMTPQLESQVAAEMEKGFTSQSVGLAVDQLYRVSSRITAPQAAAPETPPHPGAVKAPDGNWYVGNEGGGFSRVVVE